MPITNPMIASLVKLARPGDWVKNVFVLPALVFWVSGSRETPLGPLLLAAGVAFASFCLIASGFYALNDVADAEKDRGHPVKKLRPVASRAVSPRVAVMFGVVLIASSLVLASLVNTMLVLTLIGYAALQVGYNLGIKRIMLVDVIALATGFVLRAAAGAVAIEVRISVWLLLCVFFLCLYLGFIKRLCDLASAAKDGGVNGVTWRSPAGYDDRSEIDWLLAISAVVAIVTYVMYALSEHTWILFEARSFGFAILTPFVMVTIHRFYRRASMGTSDSPLRALLEDRVVAASIVLFSVGVVVTLYVPQVEQVLLRLFFTGRA